VRANGSWWRAARAHSNVLSRYVFSVRSGEVISPVPEPGTYALVLTGLVLLGIVARTRKTKWR
jgi:hypothetical protein